MKVTPKTECVLMRRMVEAGQASVWAEAAATIYSRGVARICSAWGLNPNEFLLNNLKFDQAEDDGAPDMNQSAFSQPAYHGSPYRDIDKFSLDKIGTGQGAQSYGWGLYFAGKKTVAEHYQKELARARHDEEFYVGGQRAGADNYALRDLLRTAKREGLQAALENARYYAGEYEARIARFKGQNSDFEPLDDIRRRDYYLKAFQVLTDIKNPDDIEIRRDEGQLYAVDIPDDGVLLDWDKGLSGQPEAVREAINKYLKGGVSVRKVSGSKGLYELLHNGSILMMFAEEDIAGAANNPVNYYGRGQDFYSDLSRKLGSAQAASEFLKSIGIKGIKYLDGDSRDSGAGSRNYVIFDDAAIEILDKNQGPALDVRGRTEFLDDGTVNIIFGPNADASTAIHEAAHLFRELMRRAMDSPPEKIINQAAFSQLREDWRTVENWLSKLDDDVALKNEYDRWGLSSHFSSRAFESLSLEEKTQAREIAKHERFARGFETYLMEGRAPATGLRGIFQRMKDWLLDIYQSVKELETPLIPEVRTVFDRLVATDRELQTERDANMNDLKKQGRRVKIDPKQYTFDFEAAAEQAAMLQREIEEEDTPNDDRTAAALIHSSKSPEAGNSSGSQPHLEHQPLRLQDSGQMGAELAGEAESPGKRPGRSDRSFNAAGTAADEGIQHSDEPESGGTTQERPDGIRDSGHARGGYGALDYTITDDDRLGRGGAKQKFRDNIEALRTLKRLQAEGVALASTEDQKRLVRYVGWGGLPQVFDDENAAWSSEAAELRGLLTPDEYAQARRSTQDAHYTSQEVIQGIYQGLARLGFSGGHILEPSAGIGNFIGLMPQNIREASTIQAVELDPISSSISRYLYPKITNLNRAFQDTNPPENHFDLCIGNPPFGQQKVYDPARPDLFYSIHNYFLAKSIESLREGGLAAFVVSRYFLDAMNNPAREFIASRANLLGAIRLPNTAFKQNALTEVTTDIVFFQKSREPEQNPAWLKVGEVATAEGNIRLNQYFIEKPGQMIGHMAMSHNMFRGAADLLPPPDFKGFGEEIASRLAVLPERIYQGTAHRAPDEVLPEADLKTCATLKVDSFFQTASGKLARRRADVMGQPRYEEFQPKSKKAAERIVAMLPIRDCLTKLMRFESGGGANYVIAGLRQDLNRLYDDFVKKHGHINSLPNRQAMRDDPAYPLLSSLEREYSPGVSKEVAKKTGAEPKAPSAAKADIFRHRVLGPRPKIEKVGTAKEALIVSMNEHGRPDMEFMKSLASRTHDEITRELRGLIYLNPATKEWEIADHYLTGEVKSKLKEAQAAAKDDHRFRENVNALMAVQPPDLDPMDIAVQLGSTWVPPVLVADFAKKLFGHESVREINYHQALASWVVEFNKEGLSQTAATNTYGTASYPGPRLFEAILNNTPIRVMDEVGRDEHNKPIMKQNDAETAAANQKADEIKQYFADWIWTDQKRREALAKLYNDRFNTNVPRKYDGSHLELPGSSLGVQLRPHQKDAIWRGIQDGTALFDHVVGAGKTLAVVGTIMESKRMGLMKKPMVVVPNHLLLQWQDAFYQLYPQANILVADKNDFKKENREKLFAKVATGDYDAVVVAHSSFKKIGLPPEMLKKVLSEQIDDLSAAIKEAQEQHGQKMLVKEMEKTREKLKVMMERRTDTGAKDKGVTFADLGVDALFVDESQEFKNLFITTKMRNVAGLGNLAGSQKALDLFVKCRYLQEQNKGRGVFFATGTPISNTIAEMFTVQRFLQYSDLKAKGLAHFDSWASTFGQVVAGWELDATGVGYRLNNRFAKFQNVPELLRMYRTVGDVITNSDLVRNNAGKSFTPKVKGGKPQNVVAPRSKAQARYMGVQSQVTDAQGRPIFADDGRPVMKWNEGSIIHRMEHLPKNPSIDNPLCITNDARKAGLDFRLIDPQAPDFEGSKVNVAAGKIYDIWQKWAEKKGTQLVFCDLSTPKAGKNIPLNAVPPEGAEPDEEPTISMDDILAEASPFSVYDDLRQKLIERGIPADQIRFIHEANTDAQKAKLFDEVNRGDVRVLMGSTAKMGAGTNVQRRLVALHHLDAPWRPSDLEQREGRIIRQGNVFHEKNNEFEVEIIRYATEKTYDARMWQTIQGKAEGIEEFRKGNLDARTIEDVASEAANAAEMKAAATGNELIFIQVRLAVELKKLEGVYASFQRGQHQLESRISWLEKAPERTAIEICGWKEEIALRDENTAREPCFAAAGRVYGPKQKDRVLEVVRQSMKIAVESHAPAPVGLYRGFKVTVTQAMNGDIQFSLTGKTGSYHPGNLKYGHGQNLDVSGFFQRMDNYLAKFEGFIQETEASVKRQAQELADAKKAQGQPFPHLAKLEALRRDNREVLRELQLARKDPNYKSAWKPRTADMADEQVKATAKDTDTAKREAAELYIPPPHQKKRRSLHL